jgi:putative Mg2+ transporter-C (MgtC) family protein
MAEIGNLLAREFGDLSAAEAVQLGVRLVVAGLIGGFLGWERERAGKSAGLRTHILVAVGSAAMVAVPLQAGYATDSISRVVQGLIAGVGFLGAGCILKRDDAGGDTSVRGLTTAAGIWLTAAAGIAAGMGRELSAAVIGGVGWFTLSVLGRWENWFRRPGGRT